MKICLPSEGNRGMNENVYGHFGSAPFFNIYDTEKKSLEVLKNDNEHHEHGTCNPLSVISKYNVSAILSGGMGRRAVQGLNEGGIKVYLIEGATVSAAIKNFEENKLIELTMENACGGHGCH